ncbi:contractile injection system tape measure protein [Aureispira]|nr:contractile injection system tape measure protein [Aureispira sp.]
MAKKNNKHIIEHQIINLDIEGVKNSKEASQIQQDFLQMYKTKIGEELDKLLTKLAPPGIDIQIESLELNLGQVKFKNTTELEKKIINEFKKNAQNAIKEKIKKIKQASSIKGSKQKISKANILEFFLLNGHYPSWATKKNGSIEEIFDDLIQKNPKKVARIFFEQSSKHRVRMRLYQQFTAEQLTLLFDVLYGKNAQDAQKQISIIQKRLGAKAKKSVISAAVEYVLKGGPSLGVSPHKERIFLQDVIEGVQKRQVSSKIKTKVRAGYEEKYQDVQILEYFLEHGAIPSWAEVESKKSLENLFIVLLGQQLIGLQRMLERNSKNLRFTQRLIMQFSISNVLKLLEPTSADNLRFIEDSIKDFEFLSSFRQNISDTVSNTQIKTVVLGEALDHFFLYKKTKFIKKTFIKSVMKEFARLTRTDYETLIKESYKSVRRRNKDTAICSTLESLDDNLKQKLAAERKEVLETKKEYRKIGREITKLKKKKQSELSTSERERLRKINLKFKQLEKTIEELEDVDMPLEIELLMRHREDLKSQLHFQTKKEKEKHATRLERTQKEFEDLQEIMMKEVQTLLKNKEKLKNRVGTIAEKRIKRINNRLVKYNRAVQKVSAQLIVDQKGLTLLLGEINKALRGQISSEEKNNLRKERSRLQKEFTKINNLVSELKKQEDDLTESLSTAMSAIEGDDEFLETNTSKLDSLVFMLKYGSTPWWAREYPKQTIEELFVEFAGNSPKKLHAAFQQVGKYPIVWERTINQLSEKGIKTILNYLYPKAIKIIYAQADLFFEIHYSQGFPSLKNVDSKRFKWACILEYLMSSRHSFNGQNFCREITLQTARIFNISPSKLIEFTHNVINNRKGDYLALREWNKALASNTKVGELDRELILLKRKNRQKEQGLFLSDDQKLALLTDFFSTGKVSDKAKELKYDNLDSFENLLYEQIHKNKYSTKDVVTKLLRLSNARALIVKKMSDHAFWEILYLINPSALLPIKRHFQDFSKVMKDPNLYLEKDVLLNLCINQKGGFEILDYLRAILMMRQQMTGRAIIALLSELKRSIKASGKTQSSWLLSVMMLEVQTLKLEQKKSTDPVFVKSLQQQLESLAKEYTDINQEMSNVLAEETAEALGIPDKSYKLLELDNLIVSLSSDLEKLLKDPTHKGTLKGIENKRKVRQHEAQIKLLKQRRPPLLRKLEIQIESLKKELTELEIHLSKEEKKEVKTEELLKEEVYEFSLIERQIEMLSLVKSQAQVVVKELPKLIKDLKDDDNSRFLFLLDLMKDVEAIKEGKYRTSLLETLNKLMPSVVSLDEINRSAVLDERQKKLLKNITKVSPFQLWKDWDSLEAYYNENPELLNPEKEKIQTQIYSHIRRQDQKNLLAYNLMLQTGQKKLDAELNRAQTSEELENIQEEIITLWKRQLKEVDQMLEAVRDTKTRKDLKKLKENIDYIFIKIQNKRRRLTNVALTKHRDFLRDQKVEKTMQIKSMDLEKDFIVDEINKKEDPEYKSQEELLEKPKKRPPKPKPIKEPLYIYNAGLVLLWPYIGRLFTVLNYTKDKKFIDLESQYKAIHILQYLANGNTSAPENELVLNKILCNFPISEPVPFSVEFDKKELEVAEGMLQGVIKNWNKMKTLTPASLRGSFLIREGTIEEMPENWFLKVKKATYDVLLQSLPWSYSFIQLPWTDKHLKVEWKLF